MVIIINHDRITPYVSRVIRRPDCLLYLFNNDWNCRLSDGRFLRKVQVFLNASSTILYISNDNGTAMCAYFEWEFYKYKLTHKPKAPKKGPMVDNEFTNK